jgi:4-amino-4-deoxy-L-arabinose transferase
MDSDPNQKKCRQGKKLLPKSIFIITLFYLLIYILPLGFRPLMIPDETRYAEIAREMLVSGDLVVPHLNGLRYFEKPILGHWLNAASISVFGETPFAVRLPAAVSTGLLALLLYLFVHTFCTRRTAILATLAFLTSILIFLTGEFAILDSLLNLLLSASIMLLFTAYHRKEHNLLILITSGIFIGLAFLTKGFLAIIIPLITIIPFLLWERRPKTILKLLLIPLTCAAIVILPWAIAIQQREPDFWRYFIVIEHLKRFASTHAQHAKPFWFFLPIIIAGTLPWSALAPAAIIGLRKDNNQKSLIHFCICWLIAPFIFFSISHGKLATYILPCLPPFIILLSLGLTQYHQQSQKQAFNAGLILQSAVLIILGTIAILAPKSWVSHMDITIPFKVAKLLAWTVCLIYAALLLLAIDTRDYFRLSFACIAASPILLLLATSLTANFYNNGHCPRDFFLKNKQHIKKSDTIISTPNLAPAICWYYKRDNILILANSGELQYGQSYPDAQDRFISWNKFQTLKNSNSNLIVMLDCKKQKNGTTN